jgi:hypothetical protein
VAERRRCRLRTTLIAAALATALLTLAVLIAGCGGSAASDPLAGYWIDSTRTTPILVHIVKDGEKYSVRANADTPLGAATVSGDSLVIATHAVTMTFAPGAGGTLTVTLSGNAFKTKKQILTLQRVDETGYADAAVKYGVAAIRRGLMMWARGGGQKFPPPNEVNSNGLLSKMVVPWPVNMFSGQPMQPGDSKGDYVYTLTSGGRQFTLVGHLSDGSTTKGTP